MSRTLLAEGNQACPSCGEHKQRLSRHWSYCEFPPVGGALRDLLTGILLGGGSLQGNGENTKHLLIQSTSERLARWLFAELDWLAHSLRRETFDGERDPIYHVRTHSHTHLRRLRDGWYRDGEKQLRADASLTARSARVWWALAGSLEWTGDYDSQVRGTFSAAADARADAIASVFEAHGYQTDRLDRRVTLYGDDLRDWLSWTRPPVPGAEHKWMLSQVQYLASRLDTSGVMARPTALSIAALRVARDRTDQELDPALFDDLVDEITATEVAEVLGGGSFEDAASVAGVSLAATEPSGSVVSDERSEALREYELADVQESIRKAAASEGEPLTFREYIAWSREADDRPSESVIKARYDSWADACWDVGVEPYAVDGPAEWSPQGIRGTLQAAKEDLGDDFSSSAYMDWASGRVAPAIRVIYDRYDSWQEACDDAGINCTVPQEDISE